MHIAFEYMLLSTQFQNIPRQLLTLENPAVYNYFSIDQYGYNKVRINLSFS